MLVDQSHDDALEWAVTYVAGGKELDFKEDAKERGLEVYCPIGKRKIKARKKHKVIEQHVPAFPNYAFARWDGVQVYETLGTIPSFRYMLPVLIPSDVISTLRILQDEGWFDITSYPQTVQFYVGDKVQVQSGPFVGFKGKVEQSTRGNEIALIGINNKVVKINVSNIRKLR